jgi:site-specific DNA-cytosine methylase
MFETADAIFGAVLVIEHAVTLERLHRMGYQTRWQVADASHFGVPQKRRGAILVALPQDDDGQPAFTWPDPAGVIPTVGDVLYRQMESLGWLGAAAWRAGSSGRGADPCPAQQEARRAGSRPDPEHIHPSITPDANPRRRYSPSSSVWALLM